MMHSSSGVFEEFVVHSYRKPSQVHFGTLCEIQDLSGSDLLETCHIKNLPSPSSCEGSEHV